VTGRKKATQTTSKKLQSRGLKSPSEEGKTKLISGMGKYEKARKIKQRKKKEWKTKKTP